MNYKDLGAKIVARIPEGPEEYQSRLSHHDLSIFDMLIDSRMAPVHARVLCSYGTCP